MHYLVKLSIRVLQMNGTWTLNRKYHTEIFLSYRLQNEADSDKVW